MTRDALREAAALILKTAMRRIEKKHGVLDMYFVYVLPDGSVERENVDESVPGSPEAKSIQFQHVRERARELGAEAVICVSDAWFLDPRDSVYRNRIDAIGDDLAYEVADRFGVVAAAQMGLGKALEVVQVVLDSPGWKYSLVQQYEHAGADGRYIRFVGEPMVLDDSDGTSAIRGRAARAFEGGS